MDNNISFTSLIKPVNTLNFMFRTDRIPLNNFVDYPWTCKESRKAQSAFTTSVLDCTMCGITDGKDVFMMHICPTKSANADFSKIKQFMEDKINLKNLNLRAVVIGGKYYPDDKVSLKLFDNFVSFLKKQNIPTSYLRGGDVYESVDIAYTSNSDEWIISSKYLDPFIGKLKPQEVLSKIFSKIFISDCDEITY